MPLPNLAHAGPPADATGPVADAPFPKRYACAHCTTTSCFSGNPERMPASCPTRTAPGLARDSEPYRVPETQARMRAADATPFAPDGTLRNRIDEIVAFARLQSFRRIGIAFCVTMTKEAQRLAHWLRERGFETEAVCCRVGAIDYDEIGLAKAHPERFAAICNPVAQARLLDARNVDLVVQMGLCVGHDLILQQECAAPVTTLVVKDRVHDHHSIAALRQP
jgi:uncharacterized metal-binding protein